MSCLVKPGYWPKVHAVFMLRKQQLNTIHKQYTLQEHLVGNPVFIKEDFLCIANFRCIQHSVGLSLITLAALIFDLSPLGFIKVQNK